MNISVNGNADKEGIAAAIKDSYREWERHMKAYAQQNQRVRLG